MVLSRLYTSEVPRSYITRSRGGLYTPASNVESLISNLRHAETLRTDTFLSGIISPQNCSTKIILIYSVLESTTLQSDRLSGKEEGR